ncbi:MAG: hypothetical protein IT326_06430, partial [Anaerolineae bacterium]|nr:hypothetical protein [Anaerolineae bacterium]
MRFSELANVIAAGFRPRHPHHRAIALRAGGAVALVLILGISALPQAPITAVVQGRLLTGENQFTDAASLLDEAYTYQPWDDKLLLETVNAFLSAGNFYAAGVRLEELAEHRPINANEQALLVQAYLGQGRVEEAAAIFRVGDGEALRGLLRQLANSYEEQGQWANAFTLLEALNATMPDDAELAYRLAVVSPLVRPEQTELAVQKAVLLEPTLAG